MVPDLVKSARMHIVRLMNNVVKGSERRMAKVQLAMLKKYGVHDGTWQPVVNRDESHDRSGQSIVKRDTCHELKHGLVGRRSSNTRQLGCVFQDMKPPKPIVRESSVIQKPIQRVKFAKATPRHTIIRDQNPSLGYICPGEPHQRSTNAPKFEGRSQEETEWQEQGAREAAWKLTKNVPKLKEHERATFFSPSENRCLPASTLKPEEREFVVDSGASMHMISKKDLSDAEMETSTISCSPTIVITSTGEVQTHEEAKCMSKNWKNLDHESPRTHASSIVAWKETHTPVLLMKYLQSAHARDVRLWVSTVFILISLKTEIARSVRGQITRATCRRRNGGTVTRAEKFGDLITADHKAVSDNCEFRNNHRYAVVVQDLTTQWIQAYPC